MVVSCLNCLVVLLLLVPYVLSVSNSPSFSSSTSSSSSPFSSSSSSSSTSQDLASFQDESAVDVISPASSEDGDQFSVSLPSPSWSVGSAVSSVGVPSASSSSGDFSSLDEKKSLLASETSQQEFTSLLPSSPSSSSSSSSLHSSSTSSSARTSGTASHTSSKSSSGTPVHTSSKSSALHTSSKSSSGRAVHTSATSSPGTTLPTSSTSSSASAAAAKQTSSITSSVKPSRTSTVVAQEPVEAPSEPVRGVSVRDETVLKAVEANLLGALGLPARPRPSRDHFVPPYMLELYHQQLGRRPRTSPSLGIDSPFLRVAGRNGVAANTVRSFHHTETCKTPECLQTAAALSASIDPTVNPCEDFYQFACGKWMEKNSIPADQASIQHFGLVEDDVMQVMRDLLTEQNASAIPAIKQARTLFKSCEDTDAIEDKGTEPMLELLKTAGNNTFPTLEEKWVDKGLNLTQVLTHVSAVGGLGLSPLVTWGISSDWKQTTRNIIRITQTHLNLGSRSYYLDERNSSVLTLYEQLYADILTELGANATIASQDAKDVVEFEILVANALDRPEKRRDMERLYNKMTIRNLTQRYPQFDWLDYLQKQFSTVNITLTEDEEVMIDALDYYDKLFPILTNTSSRTLLNYGMWMIVYEYAELLNKPVRDKATKFSQELKGIQRSPERWAVCVPKVDKLLPDIAGRLYVDHSFSPKAKAKVENMIHDLVDAFKEMVEETTWMSEQTKRAALEKADSIVYKIGYPDAIRNDTMLNEWAEKVNITDDSYFENTMNILLYSQKKVRRKLRLPTNDNEWFLSAATVNAYYSLLTNAIVFPAAILHKPFFSDKYMDALNYGGIGFIVGHELTHGFDDSGRSFDKHGNLHKWWQDDDLARFQKRTECMVNQYNSYVEPVVNMTVNGRLTLGEDIADNGGLKEAYRAYRKLVAKRGKEEPRLPSLDYTPDQLFFISAAQPWCGNFRYDYRVLLLQIDYHSPARFRVIGPMQNSEDFSRVFNCPKGSYMNPEKKCHVW